MKKIILLDLNKTLAEEVKYNTMNFTYDVSKDRYSKELVDALIESGDYVYLLTARTDNYRDETLDKIARETRLRLDKAIFKPYDKRFVKVHDFKREYAQGLINLGVSPDDIIAVESNFATHSEYRKLGITQIYTREKYLSKVKADREEAANSLF